MKILALDLGTTAGWCYLNEEETGLNSGFWSEKSYREWAKRLKAILEDFKPELIVCSQTNSYGHFNATRKMYMLFGIVCYVGEVRELGVVEFNDSSARKAVFGSGKLKKVEAHEQLVGKWPEFRESSPDEKDAIILALGWKIINTPNA